MQKTCERDIIYGILNALQVEQLSKQQTSQLMFCLDFQSDVNFARSIFTDRLIEIYKKYKGEFEIFLSQPIFLNMKQSTRKFMFSLMRQYHDYKLLAQQQKVQQDLQKQMIKNSNCINNENNSSTKLPIQLPSPYSIQQICQFQTKMYNIYQNIMPQAFDRNYALNSISLLQGQLQKAAQLRYQSNMGAFSSPFYESYNMTTVNQQKIINQQENYAMPFWNNQRNNSFINNYNNYSNNFSHNNSYNNNPQYLNYKHNLPFNTYKNNDIFKDEYKPSSINLISNLPIDQNINTPTNIKQSKANYLASQLEINHMKSEKKVKKQSRNIMSYSYKLQQQKKQTKVDNCLCQGIINENQVKKCTICNNLFHIKCILKEKLEQQKGLNIIEEEFQCPFCTMKDIDLFEKVEYIVKGILIKDIANMEKVSVEINQFQTKILNQKQDKYDIELRCLKITNRGYSYVTWPDSSVLYLYGDQIMQFPSLLINSSVKKRKDRTVLLKKYFQARKNSQYVQQNSDCKLQLAMKTYSHEQMVKKKIDNKHIFALGVYYVRKYTVNEVYNHIMKSIEVIKSDKFLLDLMKTSESQLTISQISVSPLDPFTKNPIEDPVRGINCLHAQCFDLKMYLIFKFTSRHRIWKCPICNMHSYQFLLDSKQKDIFQEINKLSDIPKQIIFDKNGKYYYKFEQSQEEEEEEEQKSESKLSQSLKKSKSKSKQKEQSNSH